ncbi:LacI family transcriptional regulator [Acaricomes phytoseiuli]|uniref:LacI family DNA-binding transcriptional regulator n=1 Tax=Acaricomes phytoseiuli TaxID=291968 RepID=UPI00035CEEA5|nr:LacI family DNA-binding transcriptional regulator [Acaricomes phytoseiuli]MCW1248605.1 LacI family transcriptional regulator [Acaricomes phytoseiuli]
MVSIKDVAARAGVSTATVSRALNDGGRASASTRQKVRQAASELGYVASALGSGLATGRTRNIGVIVPLIDRWFYAQVVSGIAATLQDLGYDLALYNTAIQPEQEERIFHDYIYRRQVDAVISVSLQLTTRDVEFLRSLGRPAVGIGFALAGLATVGVDDEAMARTATGHLTGLGHRRIAYIGTGPNDQSYSPLNGRLTGFRAALNTAGITPRPEWILESDFTVLDAAQKVTALLASPERPSAVFCASDEIAIGGVLGASQLGLRIPEDVSFIGIDGHEIGEALGLTTIDQQPAHQGSLAAQLLLDSLDSAAQNPQTLSPEHHLVPGTLRLRRSTRAISADLA